MAMVSEQSGPDSQLWAFGPETVTGRALSTTDIGDFSLPDLDGNEFSFSSLRGQKVLLVAWAPY
jgi:cytochrome oxidase Cu insertion factor (SCO1/SenC/PrrC family)